jgi:hypothetical protein
MEDEMDNLQLPLDPEAVVTVGKVVVEVVYIAVVAFYCYIMVKVHLAPHRAPGGHNGKLGCRTRSGTLKSRKRKRRGR